MSNESENIKESTTNYDVMLSTIDNPYDYFTDFKKWFLYDIEKGYNSCSILARIVDIPDDCTDAEANAEIERAIDEFIKHDFLNIRMKIKRKAEETDE